MTSASPPEERILYSDHPGTGGLKWLRLVVITGALILALLSYPFMDLVPWLILLVVVFLVETAGLFLLARLSRGITHVLTDRRVMALSGSGEPYWELPLGDLKRIVLLPTTKSDFSDQGTLAFLAEGERQPRVIDDISKPWVNVPKAKEVKAELEGYLKELKRRR